MDTRQRDRRGRRGGGDIGPRLRHSATSAAGWPLGSGRELHAGCQAAIAGGPPGKIEVNEVFWYGCSHCYALDPTLENWKRKQTGVRRVRADPDRLGRCTAARQLFYTLVAARRLDCMARCSTPFIAMATPVGRNG
jgi:hypothetical protein